MSTSVGASNGALHNYNKRGKLQNVWQVQQQLQRAVAAASGERQMQLVLFNVSAIFLLNFSFEQLLAGSVARARTAKNADSLQQCSHTVGHRKGDGAGDDARGSIMIDKFVL